MNFLMNSPAFGDGSKIPRKYTADGENLSPPLEWRNVPPETKSFVLLVDDPDAPSGTFHHWAVYNIPAERDRLPEGLDSGAPKESIGYAKNDFGHKHWDGPSPPQGHGKHHYHFRLAALNTPELKVDAEASASEVWEAAKPYMVGQAEMIGVYER